MATFVDFADTFIQAMFEIFIENIIIGILTSIWDSLVDLFTGNILGIAGPIVAFLMIIALGIVVSLNMWSSS